MRTVTACARTSCGDDGAWGNGKTTIVVCAGAPGTTPRTTCAPRTATATRPRTRTTMWVSGSQASVQGWGNPSGGSARFAAGALPPRQRQDRDYPSLQRAVTRDGRRRSNGPAVVSSVSERRGWLCMWAGAESSRHPLATTKSSTPILKWRHQPTTLGA